MQIKPKNDVPYSEVFHLYLNLEIYSQFCIAPSKLSWVRVRIPLLKHEEVLSDFSIEITDTKITATISHNLLFASRYTNTVVVSLLQFFGKI